MWLNNHYKFLTGFSRLGNVRPANFLLAGLLGLTLWGCRSADDATISSASESAPNSLPTKLENQQTEVEIVVPPEWVTIRDSRRGAADILATYPEGELYAKVLSDTPSVLNQFDLEDNAEQYRWLIENELTDVDVPQRTDLSEIDNKPAVQYEIRGEVDGIPVVYLHTTVQGETAYYQVVGWTREDLFEENRATLQNIIQSFRGA